MAASACRNQDGKHRLRFRVNRAASMQLGTKNALVDVQLVDLDQKQRAQHRHADASALHTKVLVLPFTFHI